MPKSPEIEEWYRSCRPKMPIGQVLYSTNVSIDKKFLYVETPKVGCSTIKATLQRLLNDGGEAVVRGMNTVHKKRLSQLSSLGIVGDVSGYLSRSDVFKFCFVRNPYTRLYSAYRDKVCVDTSRQKRDVLRLLGKDIASTEDISFEAFVKCIVEVPPKRMNPHWRVQYYQTMSDIVNFDFTGRFESFDNDLAYVLKAINGDLEAAQIELRPHRTDTSEVYKKAYSAELQKLVYDKFKQDFDFFGYPNEL